MTNLESILKSRDITLWWGERSQDKVPFHHIISRLHAVDGIYDH